MENRLIPYSVHLPETIYKKIKDAAGERKASGMVREAIINFVEGSSLFDQGHNSALDAINKKVYKNKVLNSIAYDGMTVAQIVEQELNQLRK